MMRPGNVRSRKGLTLIEAVIAMLLVAVMVTAGLSATGQASTMRAQLEQRAFAQALAHSFLAEVLSRRYAEGSALGLDEGETASDRAQFDDVDDFHDFTDSPIRNMDKRILTDASWRLQARVTWVVPTTGDDSPAETGAKLVTVTILQNGRTLAEIAGISTRQWSIEP